MKPERPLTHDERKASEAAFRGLPFDPSWSQSARAVYDGIVQAMAKMGEHPLSSGAQDAQLSETALVGEREERDSTGPGHDAAVSTRDPQEESNQAQEESCQARNEPGRLQIRSRREAIEAGFLMDVTPMAESLGLNFAVGMTKPLWDFGIEPDPDLSQEEREARVRDVLMAVRLRLVTVKDPMPIVEVPVMLTFPPEPIPQVFPIYALFHKDPVDADSLLLIHPGEVMFAKLSFSQN